MSEHTRMTERPRSPWRRVLLCIAGLISVALLGTACTSLIPSFGALPAGERLERIERSPHYKDGEFKYLVKTDVWTGGQVDYLKQTLFGESKKTSPDTPVPVVWTDIANLDINRDVAVWLGHSTVFLQVGGKRILIDPNFSSHASPVSGIAKAFEGPYPYSAERMPALDYVVISHDHWDHLDYPTLTALRSKVKAIVTPLGIGAHLERWGYTKDVIHEGDWYDKVVLEPGVSIHILPARHFSGRALSENKTLWAGFLIETPQRKIFYSGDGGYGPHFAEIAKRFGSVDVALMENGQYDPHWAQMHLMPEEAVQAAIDLKAKTLIPVHAGRFALASHAWDDPYERIAAASKNQSFRLATPRIGEVVYIDDPAQAFSQWWKEVSTK
ncbi:MBL fold metallo-hydrolase [Ralstonia pseudosolanacearum]